MNENEMQEKLEQVAMAIVVAAGDARLDANHALDAVEKFDFEEAKEHIKEARVNIAKAHSAQTETMQNEIAQGGNFPPSILFNHAQDTLMTIMSEINMAERMVKLFEIMYKKIEEKGE